MQHIYRTLALCACVFFLAACGKDSEKIKLTSIALDKTELSLEPGASASLTVIPSPDNAEFGEIVWTSDNAAVTVENGLVTAVAKGEAKVTATVDGLSATCKVTVRTEVTEITLNPAKTSVEIGKTVELTVTVLPEDADYSEITWKSEDVSVATVDASGVVTAVAEGTTAITAAIGDKSASCEVTVIKEAVIYATGYDDKLANAFSWKLGDYSATDLSTDANQATKAYDITLVGEDVYIGGTATNADGYYIPAIWKNGQIQYMMDSTQPIDGDVFSLFAAGSDVYAAGHYRVSKSATTTFKKDAAVIWKNGELKELRNTGYSEAYAVYADGDKVYVGGNSTDSEGYTVATMWISSDGAETFSTKILDSPSKTSFVEGVCVSGNDVYMVGYGSHGDDRSAIIWKNDEQGKFLDESRSYAYSVTVADGHVYVAGFSTVTYEDGECAVATLWVDGEAQLLTSIKKTSQAWDVVVKDGNVYVSGFIGGQAVIWRNGVAGAIRNGDSDSSCVTGIYVK